MNSLARLPTTVTSQINDIDWVLLTMAMAALRLTMHFSEIREAGVKPLLFAAMLFG